MDSALRKKRTIACFLLPALIVYTAAVIVPIFCSAYYSLFDWNGIGEKTFAGLGNYMEMVHDAELWMSAWRTALYAIFQVIMQVGGGLLLAVLLTKIVLFRRFFQTLYYLPVIISTVALCEMFKKIFAVTPIGLFNQILSCFNPEWASLQWLSNTKTSLWMVIFTGGYKDMAVYMLIFYASLISVPHSLEEAACIDGATNFTIFRKIQLPHLKPAMFANVILVLNGSLRAYDIPKLLTSGGPVQSSQTQALYMYKEAFTGMRYGYGSAVAIFIVIEALLFAQLVRGFNKGD